MDTKTLKDKVAEMGRAFKAFKEAEEVLQGLESAENACAETVKRLADLKAQEAGLQDAHDAAQQGIDDAKLKALASVKAAESKAQTILAEAEAKIIGWENAAADQLADAEKNKKGIEAETEQVRKRLTDLQAAVDKEVGVLADLKAKKDKILASLKE